MRKGFVLLSLPLLIVALGVYQNNGSSRSVDSGPCVSLAEVEIKKSLKILGDSKPSRSGMMTLTMPLDEEQYLALNKMAILGITVFARTQDLLPVSKIYIRQAPQDPLLVLPRVFPKDNIREVPEQSEVGTKLGTFRQDVYLLIPIHALRERGELSVQFAGRPDDLVVAKFPLEIHEKFALQDKFPGEDPTRLPNPDQVVRLIFNSYCI